MNPLNFKTFQELLEGGASLEIICLSVASAKTMQGEWRMNVVESNGKAHTLFLENGVKEATACSPATLINRAMKLGCDEISIPLKPGTTCVSPRKQGSEG